MSISPGESNFDGRLKTKVIRAPKSHRMHSVRIPGLGRVMMTRDPGDSSIMANEVFATQLTAFHRDGDGQMKHIHDLGSGLVTNVGVLALANDFNWAQNCQTLKLANNHATGTGTTSAASTDIVIQTLSTQGGQTPVVGTQTLVSAANSQKYQTVATVSYTGTEAVTEWGLFTSNTLSATTGTPFTATSATGATATGTPYTASSGTTRGEQQFIVQAGTTTVWGLVLSNTTSAFVFPAWYKVADGTAGATPGSTEAFTIKPVLWDHKVFSAINVVSGDSIQFTYQLTVNSGG